MAHYDYCAQLVASGNQQHCLYQVATNTLSTINAVLAEISPQEQRIIMLAYVERWAPQLIMNELGYTKAEYYRAKSNATNSVMKEIAGRGVSQ